MEGEKVNKTHPIVKTVVQFKLHSNPIHIWENKYKGKQLYFCINTIDLSLNTTNLKSIQDLDLQKMVKETNSPWPLMEIGILTENNYQFKVQNENGHKYNSDEFVVFQTYILYPRISGYRLEISTYDENTTTVRKIGSSVIYLKSLEGSRGTYTTLIESSGTPIGQIVIDYLFIKPLNLNVNKSADNTMHWKKGQKLNIGHRGSGKMRRLDLDKQVLENTIASFNYAVTHGADMVELDVQLTKDKIPVVYHDYYICISPKNKKEWSHQHQSQQESAELLKIRVNDLTEKQLQSLKLFPESGHTELFRDDDDTDNLPFPSLKHCLKAIVQKAGINIEIKSSMQLKDGSWELDKTTDLNEYIDIILADILNFSGTRYIIMSCFDPDVCCLIQMKQKKFPILFLTQGVTKKYPPYHDPRTSSIPMATYFALNLGIAGICAHAEEILNDRNVIKLVKSKNLLLFSWGDDLNSPVVSKSLREDGVDGIIADEIDKIDKEDPESSKKINYHRYY